MWMTVYTDRAEIRHGSMYNLVVGCSWPCCRLCSDWGFLIAYLKYEVCAVLYCQTPVEIGYMCMFE